MKANMGQASIKTLALLLGLWLTLSGCASNALFVAAQNGDVSGVKVELENGVNPNLQDSNGKTALMKAAGEGGLAANISASGQITYTSLASRGNVDTVQMLLSHGADPNLVDSNGITALHYAAMWGRRQSVEELIKAGADVNASANSPNGPPLHRAAEKGHLEIVQYLLSSGADISASDEGGQTALITASYHGQTEVIALLIEHGANINATSDGGYTPLMNAAYMGQYESAKILLDRGAIITLKTDKGETALAIAAERNHNRVAHLLREAADTQ
jgi:ankyrin repeat protein